MVSSRARAPSAERAAAGPLRILGIDPGSRKTGFACIEQGPGAKLAVHTSGSLVVPSRDALALRLATLSLAVGRLIARHQPHVAVVESLFRGVNPRSLIVLAQTRGALLAAVAMAGVPVYEYTPAEIKTAVAGNGRADKKMVARMVSMILGPGHGPVADPDESDALAVAICFAQRYRMDRAAGRIGDLGHDLQKAVYPGLSDL